MVSFVHHQDAEEEFSLDWSRDLISGESITESSWIVPTGLTKNAESFDGDGTSIVLSEGVPGETYELKNVIITSNGKTYSQNVYIQVP